MFTLSVMLHSRIFEWHQCADRSVLQWLQCVAVCCSVLQYVAVYCSVLHCAAVCCSVL